MQRIKNIQMTSFEKQNQRVNQLLSQSVISKSSSTLSLGSNTLLPTALLNQHHTASLSHMRRIADYIELGAGVWFTANEDFVEFHDGVTEPNFRPEGPRLCHFRYLQPLCRFFSISNCK